MNAVLSGDGGCCRQSAQSRKSGDAEFHHIENSLQ
jgi:hypothetical protein